MGVQAQIKLAKSKCGQADYTDNAKNQEAIKLNRPWLNRRKNTKGTIIYNNVLWKKMFDWLRPGNEGKNQATITLAGARRIYEINPFLRLAFPRITKKHTNLGPQVPIC